MNKYRKYSRYSIENPEVWAISQGKDAKKEVGILIKLLRKYGRFKVLLDVGCGVGFHVNELVKKGFICKGVDADPTKIEYAKKHYPNINFQISTMQSLKEKKRYDAIICINSILVFNESNEEVMKSLGNFYKALKKGGLLVVEVSNPMNHIKNCSFKKSFVDIGEDRKKFGVRAVYEEDLDANKQTGISKRTFYRLSDNKKVGVFKKETRLFFPQELKFFVEQAGFKCLDFYAGISLKKDLNNSRRMLIVARKK
tara:strand:- start:1235 stop:1996 length:762 start_codon:yes stop_codon:yes gene_type:complete